MLGKHKKKCNSKGCFSFYDRALQKEKLKPIRFSVLSLFSWSFFFSLFFLYRCIWCLCCYFLFKCFSLILFKMFVLW